MAKPVYALLGEDSFLQLQALAEIEKELGNDVQRSDFDGESAILGDVLDELRSFAMFAPCKLVVIRNGDEFIKKNRESLEDYLEKPSDSGTLVLRVLSLPSNTRVHKLVTKVGKIVKCEPPKLAQLPPWIVQRAKSVHKIAIEPRAAQLLADLIGEDLGRLDNELAKLALYTDTTITINDISQTVAFQREQEMYDMTNELAAGKPDQALKRWRRLVQMDSSAEFRAFTWLQMWLETSRRALAMMERGESAGNIARDLRIWPADRATNVLRTAERMGQKRLAHAVHALAQAEFHSKTGVGDAVKNVEQFLLSIPALG